MSTHHVITRKDVPIRQPELAFSGGFAAGRSNQARPFVTLAIAASDLPCVVIGGGTIGAHKAVTLAEQGVQVRVVSPEISPRLRPVVAAGRIEWLRATYRSDQLDGARLVVAATSDATVNAQIARDAQARGLLVCDVSSAEESGVLFPALHTHGSVTIAVHTRGTQPRYAKTIRNHLAALLAAYPLKMAEGGDRVTR
jgi:uroporphyrin-III C-methyltransferase/precorrin-2 dehydrogenase/sirohydrochlorin ferrochelatase